MTKYGLHGALNATPGQGQALADILLEAARLVEQAPGCLLYMVSLDDTEPDTVWVTEAWDNKEAHNQSLQIPGVRALIQRAMPILSSEQPAGQKLLILGGAGLKP